jgi:hypothetical protein
MPALGKALENLKVSIPAPRLGRSDSDPFDPPGSFIESATVRTYLAAGSKKISHGVFRGRIYITD